MFSCSRAGDSFICDSLTGTCHTHYPHTNDRRSQPPYDYHGLGDYRLYDSQSYVPSSNYRQSQDDHRNDDNFTYNNNSHSDDSCSNVFRCDDYNCGVSCYDGYHYDDSSNGSAYVDSRFNGSRTGDSRSDDSGPDDPPPSDTRRDDPRHHYSRADHSCPNNVEPDGFRPDDSQPGDSNPGTYGSHDRWFHNARKDEKQTEDALTNYFTGE